MVDVSGKTPFYTKAVYRNQPKYSVIHMKIEKEVMLLALMSVMPTNYQMPSIYWYTEATKNQKYSAGQNGTQGHRGLH